MTDRQRWNWHHTRNARAAVERFHKVNTESVCDATPFLRLEERRRVETFLVWLDSLLAELEQDRRSRATDRIQLVTDVDTETHVPRPKVG